MQIVLDTDLLETCGKENSEITERSGMVWVIAGERSDEAALQFNCLLEIFDFAPKLETSPK